MREAPRMIVAYTDDDGRKAYVHKRQAYYAIAKAMVVAKYPAWLNEGRGAAGRNATLPDGWTPKLVLLRQRKSYDLF
ncbi:MAG TPA: hypothetical protein VFD36_29600, partial [Kofleriaceae bacterium]|nr:hypothetical protein [Kofleriaceae bacterium]